MASNYGSPGAAAVAAIEQLLLQEELRKRQAFLDSLASRDRDLNARRIDLDEEQERRIAAAQKEAQENLEAEREYRRAQNLAQHMLPGESDENTAEMLDKHGFTGIVKKTPGKPVIRLAPSAPALLQLPQLTSETGPDRFESVGGSAYQQARKAAEERAELAQQAQEAAAERARETEAARTAQNNRDNETRELVARIGASNRNANADLQRELLQARVDAANDKKNAANDEKLNKRKVAVGLAQETLGVLDQLLDANGNLKPGVSGLFGATTGARWIPGSQTADAEATLNQLVGKSVVDLISEMKSQSRTGATGFGALSEKELKILQDAANKLSNRWQSDKSAQAELKRIREKVRMVLENQASTTPGAVVEWELGPDGKPRRK